MQIPPGSYPYLFYIKEFKLNYLENSHLWSEPGKGGQGYLMEIERNVRTHSQDLADFSSYDMMDKTNAQGQSSLARGQQQPNQGAQPQLKAKSESKDQPQPWLQQLPSSRYQYLLSGYL
ncbi:hypothetical protein HD806DRAFT_540346 [Xylariaceae sp. AK1471]|nr:hypothetical protein HD806DRAFT_540346 [Xylariaceae sp. AK1471]